MTDTTETPSAGRVARRRSTSEHTKKVPGPGVSWGFLLLVFVVWYPSRALTGTRGMSFTIRSFAYSALLFVVLGAALECLFVVRSWWINRHR